MNAERRPRPAAIPIATIFAVVAAAGTTATVAVAVTAGPVRSTIGRTYPIAEPDALAEIEANVARLPKDLGKAFGPRANWSALRAAGLGVAAQDRVRSVVPFYTLDFDIRLPDGRTLYPKGYSFNPLTYVRLPQRLVVVHPRDMAWALRTAKPADMVLVTAGDAIDLSERTGRAIYILEQRVKERLGLTVAPVIVSQEGARLVLREYAPSRTNRPKVAASKGDGR